MSRCLVSNRIAQLLCVAALLWLFGASPPEHSSACAHAREAGFHAHDQLQHGELRGRSQARSQSADIASGSEAVADQRILMELITALDRARRDHQDHRARR